MESHAPFHWRIQWRPSASAVRSPFHLIPSRGRSSGWTGMIRYALATSILASSANRPRRSMIDAAWSIDAHVSEHSSGDTPSLTLRPAGCDKSTISLHLPGWCGFGITPKRLTWTSTVAASGPVSGPITRPAPLSFAR